MFIPVHGMIFQHIITRQGCHEILFESILRSYLCIRLDGLYGGNMNGNLFDNGTGAVNCAIYFEKMHPVLVFGRMLNFQDL